MEFLIISFLHRPYSILYISTANTYTPLGRCLCYKHDNEQTGLKVIIKVITHFAVIQ